MASPPQFGHGAESAYSPSLWRGQGQAEMAGIFPLGPGAGRQAGSRPPCNDLKRPAQIRHLFQGLPRPPDRFPQGGGRSLAKRLPEDDATTQAKNFGLLSLAGGQAESRSKGTEEAPSVGLRCSQMKAKNRTRDLLLPQLCHRCFPRFRSSVFLFPIFFS